MKDIIFVNKILNQHNISSAEFARSIGTTRQNVHNWSQKGGIPKKYLLQTAKYLSKITNKNISTDKILSVSSGNDTKQKNNVQGN